MKFFSVMPNFKGVILNSFQDPEILTCVRMTKRKIGMTSDKGFTLIELLVVMIAFMVTGTVIASVIFTHVKAIDKTNTETTIRQAGNSIVSQMSKDIRNAGTIDLQETPTDPKIDSVKDCKSINYLQLNTSPKKDTQNDISYRCDLSNIKRKVISGTSVPTYMASDDFLVDGNSITVSGCKFTCQVVPGGLPVITIDFTLAEETTSVKSKSIGQKVSIPFTTSIQMRNVQ